MSHALRIDVSHGQDASLYIGDCSCGWVSGDGRDEETVRAEFDDHVAGIRYPWQMKRGEDRSWQQGIDPKALGPL